MMRSTVGKLTGASLVLTVLAVLPVASSAVATTEPAARGGSVARPSTAGDTGARTVLRAQLDPEIDLCARTGTVTMPDAEVVPIWGYSLDTGGGCGPAQLPGPVIEATAGETVTIHLTNADVPENVSVVIPGQGPTPDTEGIAAGQTRTYSFTATDPGTYLYQSGVAEQLGVLMGLHGALLVRPTTAGQAYDTPASAFDTEAVLVLSEIDPDLNADPTNFNRLHFAPKYWLINGTAYPQTANIDVTSGDHLLLRYLNAGSLHHTMTLLGTHQRVIAKDAYPTAYPFDVVAETVPAGATLDTIATIPAAAPVETRFPLYSRQLHLTNNGAFPGGMFTNVEVTAAGTNQPPVVNAGTDQIVAALSANLDGTVSDDGLTQPVTTTWSMVSGPGTVTFGNPAAIHTTASFSAAGGYILRLSAYDGQFTTSDDVAVSVNLGIHVGDLDGTAANISTTRWRATVTVTVHNALHQPVSGAVITGVWSGGDTNGRTLTCTTTVSGSCNVTSGRLFRTTDASVTFTVSTVTRNGNTYQPSANHDPDGDSTGTAIVVPRP